MEEGFRFTLELLPLELAATTTSLTSIKQVRFGRVLFSRDIQSNWTWFN